MRNPTISMALAAAVLLCAGALPGAAGERRPPVAARGQTRGEDSIWKSGNMLRDRDFQVHDLVTIVIRESSKTSTSLETDYQRNAEIKLDIAKAFSVKPTDGGSLTYEPLTAGSKKPELDISSGRKHEGEGEIEHEEKFEARLTAEIIEILPNGDLVVEARKRVTMGEERSELILTGRVRPQDVKRDNTVESDRVADSHIQYRPKGAVADANKRGWVYRLFDFINIF